jgi:hypothetical protein
MSPRFHDTIPVRGPVEISPQEADKLIRESWPRPHLYVAEAATEVGADDETDPLPGGPMAALMLVGLLVVAAAVVAALVIVVLGVAQ